MKLRVHNQAVRQLSHLLETNPEDCVAWTEEFLKELRDEDDDGDGEPIFEKLGDNLYPEQVALISQQLIKHYHKEETVTRGVVSGLVYNFKTN